jgi:methyl-accepting chemotaxis protein
MSAAYRRLVCGLPPYRPHSVVAILETTKRIATEGSLMNLNLEALETSFDVVAPRGDELMEEFYTRLFDAAPAVTPLFAGTDLRRQKAMLLGTLVLLRKSLRNLDSIVPKLRELGARHVAYGAQPEHYPVVGEVLIAAMATIAGSAWRSDYERAWQEAFAVVAGAMIDGATEATLDAAA